MREECPRIENSAGELALLLSYLTLPYPSRAFQAASISHPLRLAPAAPCSRSRSISKASQGDAPCHRYSNTHTTSASRHQRTVPAYFPVHPTGIDDTQQQRHRQTHGDWDSAGSVWCRAWKLADLTATHEPWCLALTSLTPLRFRCTKPLRLHLLSLRTIATALPPSFTSGGGCPFTSTPLHLSAPHLTSIPTSTSSPPHFTESSTSNNN
jgi:hypothetical protein